MYSVWLPSTADELCTNCKWKEQTHIFFLSFSLLSFYSDWSKGSIAKTLVTLRHISSSSSSSSSPSACLFVPPSNCSISLALTMAAPLWPESRVCVLLFHSTSHATGWCKWCSSCIRYPSKRRHSHWSPPSERETRVKDETRLRRNKCKRENMQMIRESCKKRRGREKKNL